MKLFLIATVLAGSVSVILVVIRLTRRTPHVQSNSSVERLGPVSQQWLTTHRGERS